MDEELRTLSVLCSAVLCRDILGEQREWLMGCLLVLCCVVWCHAVLFSGPQGAVYVTIGLPALAVLSPGIVLVTYL